MSCSRALKVARETSSTLLIGLGLAAAAVAASCGDQADASREAVGSAAPDAGAPRSVPLEDAVAPVSEAGAATGPSLAAASFVDRDGSHSVSAGDEVILRFAGAVKVQNADPLRDLELSPGDSFGAGAYIAPGAAEDQLVVHIGVDAKLSLGGTYLPASAPGPGHTPARVAVALGRRLDAIVGAKGDPVAIAAAVALLWSDPEAAPYEPSRSFTEPALAGARAYFGNLHAHTGFSDGKLDPAQAHAHARGVGLDFMATSDHLEQLQPGTWAETEQMALAEARPDAYVTLRGFEWGHAYQPPLNWCNHVNIIGTTKLLPLVETSTIGGLYREAMSSSYPDGAFAIFNHPYISKPPLVYDQWNDLAYDGSADKLMALIDCEGKGSPQTPELGFLRALAKGWHLAPSSNQDNHDADWGDKNDRRTGVWLARLEGAELRRAIREGRAFSTSDRNAHVRLIANGSLWMGSTIATPGPVKLRVEAGDGDSESFVKIELWSNGVVVHTETLPANSTTAAFELDVDPTVDAYFFARVYQADGDELFSAPIYVDR